MVNLISLRDSQLKAESQHVDGARYEICPSYLAQTLDAPLTLLVNESAL
jgi:hypothetical protein